MEKFKFRLERVLDVKRIREKEKQREWVVARMEREERQREEHELKLDHQAFNNRRKTNASIGEMKIEAELSRGIRFKIRKQAIKVAQATLLEDQANQRLLEAMKERKVLDNLRDRKQEEHRIEENRQEQKSIDEVASRRYIDTLHKGSRS